MSGPKCNQYVIVDEARLERLRKEQQARLEEERRKRREKLERERLAREKAERENSEFTDIFSEIESSERAYLAAREDFELAYGDYCSACAVSGSTPEQIDFDADKISGITALLSEMTRKEEEKALENAKNRYIAESINQCMIDSGFRPLCTVGEKSRMTVYDFGDNTAVSVVSSGSKATFEVAGIADVQRAPDADEKRRITAGMERFCKAFDRLSEKLEEKGIGTENIYRMPVHEKYARVISIPKGKARIQSTDEETRIISAERKRENGK